MILRLDQQCARKTSPTWLRGLRAYLASIAVGNLGWESLQLPLYTIWNTGTFREQAFAVVHCTINFRRVTETLIVMLSVPFALVGGLWLMWWLGFNLSVAVAVGFIALAGVAAETGVVMLIYLDSALTQLQGRRSAEGRPFTRDDLRAAIMAGAVERVRPKMMTVFAIMAGLLPIMWSHGTGAEVMARIAVPMIGGMVSSTLLTLIVIPAIYAVVKGVVIRSPRLAPSLQQP
jgi:Cu(I)/Ag(I) efflux system membrane protein CusA/SilA